MMDKIKIALIGAGQRGADTYAPYVLEHPEDIEFVAVAEPDKDRRDRFCSKFHLKEEQSFDCWEDFFEQEKIADAVLICTQDRDHIGPALKALEKGYHILLEKPLSYSKEECEILEEAAAKSDSIILVCHVLRYTPYFRKVKQLLDQNVIGTIQNIHWIENVGFWHQAHSFVRGNWRKSKETSPMILAKCCHDMDMILWLMNDNCKRVSSFGSLGYFKLENAPEGSTERCLDGCAVKDTCPYYAPRIYLEGDGHWQVEVIKKVVSADTSTEAVTKALQTGNYGRCVFRCDNDVVDHQVVNMEFEHGAIAALTMSAFSQTCSREIKIMGTHGELSGCLEENEIIYKNFTTGEKKIIPIQAEAKGHGGGDAGIMKSFIEMIRTGTMAEGATSISISVQGHKIAFAAEESRLTGKIVEISNCVH